MLFVKPRTVEVSTQAELDAALAKNNVDNIVVNGDTNLLRYAEEKAGSDPGTIVRTEINTTTFVSAPSQVVGGIGDRTIARKRAAHAESDPFGLDKVNGDDLLGDPSFDVFGPVEVRSKAESPPATNRAFDPDKVMSSPAAKPPGIGLVLTITAGLAIACVIGGSIWFSHRTSNPSSNVPAVAQAPATRPLPPSLAFISPTPGPQPSDVPVSPPTLAPSIAAPPQPAHSQVAPLAPDSSGATPSPASNADLPMLAWAGVALVAIVALYLIAKQAIAGGQNVEISWKVTSKVEGKVIISRVQPRRQRQPKAA